VPRPWGSHTFNDYTKEVESFLISEHTNLANKVQYGIVPVEKDGSAYFEVPADRNIFFQALDENYMEIQRERTFVNYRPGEVRSCIGCHERTLESPIPKNPPLALLRPPSKPGPQPGETTGLRVIDFEQDIQPILDAKCVSCHSDLVNKPQGLFTQSYNWLIRRDAKQNDRHHKLIGFVIDELERDESGYCYYMKPYSLGSYTSRLISMLSKGHEDVKLTQAEMVKFITWVDSMGQFSGMYWGRRHARDKDHPNYRPQVTVERALAKYPYWIDWKDR
jgi:hypothetical protein